MRIIILWFLALLLPLQAGAQIYRWTDSNGQVHFSDKPHKNAEEVNLPPTQTYSPPPQPNSDNNNDAAAQDDDEPVSASYKMVKIVQPTPEATIRNNQGLVPVVAEFEPKLKQNDTVQLIYDGKAIGEPQNNPSFTLSNVLRGTHTVSVKVFSSDGKLLNESESVTFHMHRPRVNMGNVPLRRRR